MKVRVALAIVFALLLSGAAALTYGVAFATDPGRRVDARIFNRIGRGDQSPLRRDLRRLGQRIGGHKLNVIAVVGVGLVGVTLVLLSIVGKTRLRGSLVLVLVGGAFAATEILKPPLGDWGQRLAPDRVAADAFPSGHATLAMAIVLAGVMAVPARMRLAATICGALLGTVLGLLIVVGGLHPPSDVVGGYFVAGTWAALLTPLVGPARASATRRHPRLRRLSIGTLVLAALGFALAIAVDVEYIFGAQRALLVLVSGLVFVSTIVVAVIGMLADLGERSGMAALTCPNGEVSEWPKERDWKSRTC